MNTFLYCLRQGFSNLTKNKLFTLASIATVSSCIFLFCMFFSIAQNIRHIAYEAETNVGITVFFREDADMASKDAFKDTLLRHGGIREINYISADDAWETFKQEYFGDRAEELAEAFADDNPLAQSDSFEIFLENIEDQPDEVEYIRSFDVVREVNYANTLVDALNGANRVIYVVSAAVIVILFAISVFLISNTISVAAAFRKRENQIMRIIGATNFMIRAPFVVEGTMIGLFGAICPLVIVFFVYRRVIDYSAQRLGIGGGMSALGEIAQIIPLSEIYPVMAAVGLAMGLGMGFIVSILTIRKHLKA